jgi:hypothetical protein
MKNYNGIINLSEPEDDYCIYKMYSSNKEDNSIYIGVTRNYKERAYKHSVTRKRKEYIEKPLYVWINKVIDEEKENVLFELIETRLSEKQAFDLEIEYIKKYKELNYRVLNLSNGGKGHTGFIPWNKNKKYSKELIAKLSNAHKGKPSGKKGKKLSDKTKELISLSFEKLKKSGWSNPRKKKVYKYTKDKENLVLLAVYNGLGEAGKKENVSFVTVGEWCRNEKKPRNGYLYSYHEL